jgi:ethanolamine utilization cobalamin adenosyltransferase
VEATVAKAARVRLLAADKAAMALRAMTATSATTLWTQLALASPPPPPRMMIRAMKTRTMTNKKVMITEVIIV